MTPVARSKPEKHEPAGDAWALLQRVLASRQFEKSARLREFLSYVTERVLTEPGVRIHEQEIATRVFLRLSEGAKGEDTTVRVHAYQLRKRLDEYFATDGADESLIIEIPKGNYAPVFRFRENVPAGAVGANAVVVSPAIPADRKPSATRIGVAAAITLTFLSGVAWWVLGRPARQGQTVAAPSALTLFWSQFAHKDRRMDIVLADSAASLFADIVHHPTTLAGYLNRDYWKEAEHLPTPELREAARMIMSRQHTSIGDANLAFRMSPLLAHENAKTTIFFARDFHVRYLKTDDVVLLGSSRSNPWTELFENQLNFRFTYNEELHEASLANTVPMPGEAAQYRVHGDKGQLQEGYCRIAFVANTGRTGSVLLIAGTEMEGTEAGGEFLTSEPAISQLRKLLRLAPSEPFPYFEALLRTTRIGGAAPRFEIVTVRRPTM